MSAGWLGPLAVLDWTGWHNPYAIAYMLVMLGLGIFIWLIPDEYVYE